MFLYHSTSVKAIEKILEEGLRPSGESYRTDMVEDMEAAAEENAICLPISREDVVFCFASFDIATRLTSFDTGSATDTIPLRQREGIIVVDPEEINTELYVADFQYFSDIIDLTFMDEPDHAVASASYEDALINYANSVTPITEFESVTEMTEAFHTAEVLVEGGISESHFTEVIFAKDVLGTGYYSSYPALPPGQ